MIERRWTFPAGAELVRAMWVNPREVERRAGYRARAQRYLDVMLAGA